MEKTKKVIPDGQITPFWKQNWMELDRVFDNFRRDFERTLTSFPAMNLPPLSSVSCDIVDEGDKFVIHADMPGVSKEDVKLNSTGNIIEISAEHKEESEDKKKDYVRKERKNISYYRKMPLPDKVDASKAKAKLNNGVLTINIPKINPTPKEKGREIPVQ